ncbi:MAG: glycerophosphodiester phosphodiesterase family protein [Fimbriimonadales bacterium]
MARERQVIAHRGASGYLPEHTLEAYALAYGQGADMIEPDLVLTRDGVPICLHDLWLETTTDVAQKFPGRARSDGHYYAIDFTLDEIKRLRAWGRAKPDQQAHLPPCEIPTLEEMIRLVQHLNRQLNRSVGIVPEMKAPTFHQREGKPMEEPVLKVLDAMGYQGRNGQAIVQCFEEQALVQLRSLGCELPLVFLSSTPLTTDDLERLKKTVNGIGSNRRLIEDDSGRPVNNANFVWECHRRGLAVYPWTFKAEEAVMRRFFHRYGVDGLFTDNPDLGVRARDRR